MTEKNKSKSKPLILAMKDAENELVKTVNELMSKNNLPCYFFELIFDKIHRQLKDGAKNELAQAERSYLKTEKTDEAKSDAKEVNES